MQNLFLSPELSLIAKEKGFKERCLAVYQLQGNNRLIVYSFGDLSRITHLLPAPLYQQIIDWFETKNIWIQHAQGGEGNGYLYYIFIGNSCHKSFHAMTKAEVLNKAIEEAFNLLK